MTKAMTDERRQITVAFLDLVGSTEMASHLDPEDWHDILDRYQKRIASIVEEHGGIVIQFQGDGVLTCFGYPRAVESAARDAVAAALACVRAVASIGRLQARAGVHTGVVVVTPPRAGSAARPADIFGEVPNLASRLQAVAAPGEVLVSEETASVASGFFELAPLEPLRLRGITRPVPAYRVLRAGRARSRLEASRLVGFVSRRAEWDWLRRHWDAALSGSTRAVLVAGEPGIGKSRLAFEFGRSRAMRDDASLLIAYCTRASKLNPLQPFHAPVGHPVTDPGEIVRWMRNQCDERPVLLIIDDAQWADPSSLEAVERLLRLRLPMLTVLTARPESMELPAVPYPVKARLLLDRLNDDDAAALIARTPGGADLPPDVVRDLVQRADGVPLYLEELARVVAGTDQGSKPPVALTVTLTDVITARLDRLGPARRLAQLAAVVGREFDRALVSQIADLDAQDLDGRLQELVEQAIVEADGNRPGVYQFRHALIHETAYQSLLRPDRRGIHQRIADALASDGDQAPQVVAYHLGHAGRPEQAAGMWREAARAARLQSRFREAAGHERQILQLLPQLPAESRAATELAARTRLALCLGALDQGSAEVLREAARSRELARGLGDHRSLLRIHLMLVTCWQARNEYKAIDESLPEALELCRQVGDALFTASVHLMAGAVWIWQGKLSDALPMLEESFTMSGMPLGSSLSSQPPLSPPAVIGFATSRIAAALGWWLSGDARTAARLVEDTLQFTADRKISSAEAVTAATAAIVAQLEGDKAAAAGHARIALEARTVDERPDDGASARWQSWASSLAYWAGSATEAPELPGPMLHPYFLMLRASDGRLPAEEAVALLDEALSTARASGELFCEAEILRTRGRLLCDVGRTGDGVSDLTDAVRAAGAQNARSLELKALTDLLEETGEPVVRERLAGLVAELSGNGPSLLLDKATDLLAARRP